MRRILLTALVLFGASVAVAAASTGGLPNIGKPAMKTQPVYKGYYDHHIDTTSSPTSRRSPRRRRCT
jgi:hypothetical protein